ncbi:MULTISPECIES: glycosyltransferase family 4 protein [unclassified Streptomyces]|uniref:glycosyltransferase family 4 protein n=1 Tax=unclassified Streptomyces TaxID=2593676 RepID=UPI00081E2DC4|nr:MULTISPECIES: glycosyltransferase family 4 protein [unclassified Streptomyces]MYZ37960.1 glycosyltransferase [Streptomyces sp. SID4917]SCF95380.1 Glycosyltransferase involved in cell wall bisynthesis [Streptomyces sp. MnatMP-M17]
MTRPLIMTGIDLPLEPSCGSTIWCNDVYQRLAPDFRTMFLALPGSGGWQHSFEYTVDLAAAKRPYGPDFAQYAEKLTEEVERLVRERRPDLIHAQHLGFGLALAFARAAGSTPLISIAHGTDVIAAAENEQARDALIEIVAASTAVAVPNAAMADQVNALTQRKFNDRLITVPWGIPVPVHPTIQPSSRRQLRLLHAGRLDTNKSTITAIEAMALTANEHHLTVIGSGSELPSLTARTAELGLTHRIRFEPFMPREELWHRFAYFDAFLFTTRQLEAFGLVAVEAQAHGLPVIYGDLPGLRHTLGAGTLAYQPGDATTLAARIDQLAGAPELRRTLGAAAADSARRHDIRTTTAHLRELSKTVMGAIARV